MTDIIKRKTKNKSEAEAWDMQRMRIAAKKKYPHLTFEQSVELREDKRVREKKKWVREMAKLVRRRDRALEIEKKIPKPEGKPIGFFNRLTLDELKRAYMYIPKSQWPTDVTKKLSECI
jgi:hypothetical protein